MSVRSGAVARQCGDVWVMSLYDECGEKLWSVATLGPADTELNHGEGWVSWRGLRGRRWRHPVRQEQGLEQAPLDRPEDVCSVCAVLVE